MRIRYAAKTDPGLKRNHNEDYFSLIEDEQLFLVADGMGGHACGEVASKMAADVIREFFVRSKDDDATWPFKMDKHRNYDENRLATGIKLANARIYEAASGDPNYRGMGTTIATVHFAESSVYYGHVGDSRVYLYRDGKLSLMTEDHSLLNDYLKAKKLSPEEIEAFPHKNVIVRALGMKDTVKVDTRFEVPALNDIYLLCSDGLCGPVTDEQISQILSDFSGDIKAATAKLIEKANENGGPDNVTAVLVRWSQ